MSQLSFFSAESVPPAVTDLTGVLAAAGGRFDEARAGLDAIHRGAEKMLIPGQTLIGTLIGMVQMFANMTDPSKLGPFMAVALLATFYGAAVANLLCLPIADKLHLKLVDEEINRTLIIDGILMIREAKSPTLVREMLLAYLPEKHRDSPETVPA